MPRTSRPARQLRRAIQAASVLLPGTGQVAGRPGRRILHRGYHIGAFPTKTTGEGRVQALTTAARPPQAVVLKSGTQAYALTPHDPDTFVRPFKVRSPPDKLRTTV